MAKTIIEWNGKRYQVVRLKDVDLSDTCKGCALDADNKSGYPCGCPCYDYDYNSIYHILKEIKNGTKK